jgi:basic membrane lipoprotein Med (substrate-binding protein (PBP1-ABC) superfamily)
VGVVGGMPVAEVNRVVNAFIAGAKEARPDVKVFVAFINSWYDPDKAGAAAEAQIAAGADLLFGERSGVIEVAKKHGLMAFGNMQDQSALGPETVVTGPVWNMGPTVTYAVSQVRAGSFTAQDLKDFSMMAKGGAKLAPYTEHFTNTLPPTVVSEINDRSAKIMSGLFRVPILEETPVGD